MESKNTDALSRMDWKAMLNLCLCPVYNRIQGMERFPFGSVFFNPASRETLERQLEDTRLRMQRPGLLTADMEMGAGAVIAGEVEFPSMRAAGISGNPELARKAGLAAATAGKKVGGLNWTLAPCVDICACPRSPMASIRSAGADADCVIRTALAYVKGLREGGCMATAKHFPGDGYSELDQHLTTVINPLSMDSWWEGPGRVYRELITAGVDAIMPGHIALPAYEAADPKTGLHRPATLSRRLITDLLRGELGFEGLVVSDAVEMAGMVGYLNYFDACEAFLNAGGDILLFAIPDERFYHEMESRLRRGTLREETLANAATRVLSAIDRSGKLQAREQSMPSSAESVEAAVEMAEAAILVASDRYDQLPLQLPACSRILHLVLEQGPSPQPGYFARITEGLKSRFDSVIQWDDPGCERITQAVRMDEFDAIVCSISCQPSFGTGTIRLTGPIARNLMNGWMRFGKPVVFISHGDPHVHEDYEALMDIVVNTHGISPQGISKQIDTMFSR